MIDNTSDTKPTFYPPDLSLTNLITDQPRLFKYRLPQLRNSNASPLFSPTVNLPRLICSLSANLENMSVYRPRGGLVHTSLFGNDAAARPEQETGRLAAVVAGKIDVLVGVFDPCVVVPRQRKFARVAAVDLDGPGEGAGEAVPAVVAAGLALFLPAVPLDGDVPPSHDDAEGATS